MKRYYVIIVGEHTALGREEVQKTVSLCTDIFNDEWFQRVYLFEAHQDPSRCVIERAAFVRAAGEVISEFESIGEMLSHAREVEFEQWIDRDASFSVRVVNLTGKTREYTSATIEREIGAKIQERTGASVNLEKPLVNIQVVLSSKWKAICRGEVSKLRGELLARKPGRKAWFHPSMMNPLMARAMCNLARVLPEECVLDPFCGGGGILSEIAFLGARAIGMDLSWRFLKGAEINLSKIPNSDYGLILGNAKKVPIGKCDHIVTDPPYGRVSSTRGTEARLLVKEFLAQIPSILKKGGSACISASAEMQIANIAESLGLDLETLVKVRVHAALTRDVVVIRY